MDVGPAIRPAPPFCTKSARFCRANVVGKPQKTRKRHARRQGKPGGSAARRASGQQSQQNRQRPAEPPARARAASRRQSGQQKRQRPAEPPAASRARQRPARARQRPAEAPAASRARQRPAEPPAAARAASRASRARQQPADPASAASGQPAASRADPGSGRRVQRLPFRQRRTATHGKGGDATRHADAAKTRFYYMRAPQGTEKQQNNHFDILTFVVHAQKSNEIVSAFDVGQTPKKVVS